MTSATTLIRQLRAILQLTQTEAQVARLLAEEALGGPAALGATPFQRATGGATKAISLPVRTAREGVNRAVSSAQEVGEWAREAISEVTNRAARSAERPTTSPPPAGTPR